ncbi:predicted protein [Plenodomus lingam JN3]|uniref:Uncharacterized protein n=1 Tax=Leptosphaeria maculans (strain JN3 / isolate v23.1.3 / race Av1-4-5-6-7-8) TaxID=985895 RepID=M1ZMG6_LEPMJ|nr:predicted protein [Plenodomus lingam JN3]
MTCSDSTGAGVEQGVPPTIHPMLFKPAVRIYIRHGDGASSPLF